MPLINIELESSVHAIERFRDKQQKKRKPLIATGFMVQAGVTEKSVIVEVSRRKNFIIYDYEGLFGRVSIPLRSKKETAILPIK